MAIHASPGVYWELKDYSSYATELTKTTLALVGKSVKGPTVPTFISSVRQFTETFGYPRKEDFSALAAISYLEYGNALWFRRIIGSDATKAGTGLPTANPIVKEKNIVSVDSDYGYVLSNDDNKLGSILPGTVCVEIKKEGYSTSYIRDNGEGIFDPNMFNKNGNNFLTDTVNYVNYSTGDFRFTLKNNKVDVDKNGNPVQYNLQGDLFVKYLVNTFEYDAPAEITPTSGKTFTGNIPIDDTYHTSIKSSTFALRLYTNNETLLVDCIDDEDKSKNGQNNIAKLKCSDTDKFESGTLNLTTGAWEIKFKTSITNPLISISEYIVEQYNYKKLGNKRHYTDTINLPLYKKGFYIYDLQDAVYDKKYDTEKELLDAFAKKPDDFVVSKKYFAKDTEKTFIKESSQLKEVATEYKNVYELIANNFNAIAKDDGLNGITGEVCNAMNKVDYNTGKISLICSYEPEDRTFDVSTTAKFINTIGTTKTGMNTYSYNFDCALIPNSISILIDNTLKLVDDGNGSLVSSDDLSKIMGRVIYHQKSLTDGKIKGSLEFDYNSTDSNKVIKVSYLKEIGYVESRNYGESDNGLTLEFFAEDFKDSSVGYFGLKLWNADTYTNATPTETFRKFTFGDSEKATYFTNKATSQYVTFELYDEDVVPVINYPVVISGGYSDADNITESSAIVALNDFNNPETYDINLIACPDYPGDKSITAALFELCENTRGDCFCVVDPPKGLSVQNVVAWHNGDGIYANENALTSRHGALYYPWIKISNEFTESLQFVPPSVKVLSVYAYSDNNADVWFAPAGLNRGKIFAAVALERQLTVQDRDLLYATDNNAVNPICDFPTDGIAIWGQKTLQRDPSALDRVNVMRMILYVTKVLATSTKYLLFEPHDPTTWEQYTMLVEPFLEKIKAGRGLTDYLVKCDATTNTTSDMDNNTMVAEVSLQPVKTTERIITRFKITGAGATLNNLTTTSA